MYEYLVTYSYYQDGRRIEEYDTFFASNAQEAVDECRAENVYLFSEMFGRIESVHRDSSRTWDVCENWE